MSDEHFTEEKVKFMDDVCKDKGIDLWILLVADTVQSMFLLKWDFKFLLSESTHTKFMIKINADVDEGPYVQVSFLTYLHLNTNCDVALYRHFCLLLMLLISSTIAQDYISLKVS